ncbi:MAG: hypothetical protein KKE73_01255 [Proteobacteria bacterium]|nr:hypothetical protein [Pseudomonadota bacterium]
MQNLANRMFVLKDGRDMRLIVIRMSKQGESKEQLQANARDMTMADFESYVEKNSAAKRLVYVGSGAFRLDALDFVLDSEQFSQGQLFLKLKTFEVAGHSIDSVILEKVILDGRDFSSLASMKIYRGVLEMMARQ